MTLVGNLALGGALVLLIYPFIPNLPKLRAALGRTRFTPAGFVYTMIFVLMPRWLRMLLATVLAWNLLTVAMALSVHQGALDWSGLDRLPQYLLLAASCFSMAEIGVLIGLTQGDLAYKVPNVIRAISPWAAQVLPLAVMAFAVGALNPALTGSLSPWTYRLPLLAASVLSLPIGALLFVRWIKPSAVTANS